VLLGALVSLGGSKKMGVFMWRPNRRDDLDLMADLIQTGRIEPLIDRRIGLADVPEALRYLQQGQARGKIVVTS
jgi:NADPH:quinone reductase-like Zn-dependent oxidoreductase